MSGNPLLMALHSSTERFGVAVFDPTSSTGTSVVEAVSYTHLTLPTKA